MTDPGLRRPRQVTVSGGIGLAGCVLLVIGLFDTMAATRSADKRDQIAEFLSQPPWDGLGLSVSQFLDLWRAALFVTGGVAATAFVLGVFVFQRHNGARIGFTIAAGLCLLAMPAVGAFPVLLAVAAVGLWSQAARDWFAGRTPQPVVRFEQPPVQRPPEVHQPPPQQPPQQPAQAPQQPAQAPQPAPAPYPYAYVAPPVGRPMERPTAVLWAAILTWVTAGLVAVGAIVAMIEIAVTGNELRDRMQQQIDGDAALRDFGVTGQQMVVMAWIFLAVVFVWSIGAVVVAVFAYRQAAWARITLVISACLAGATALLGVLVVAPLLITAVAGVTVYLLFRPDVNAWYARRPLPPRPSSNRPW